MLCIGPNFGLVAEHTIWICTTCNKIKPEHREPLLSSSFPERPWSRVTMDFFEWQGKVFMLAVDYFSRWIELCHLECQTSTETITKIKSIFSMHGIPDLALSYNGPQFTVRTMGKMLTKARYNREKHGSNSSHTREQEPNYRYNVSSPWTRRESNFAANNEVGATRSGQTVKKPKRMDLWSFGVLRNNHVL